MADETDVFLRHQLYVEGYKNGQAKDSDSSYEEIAAVILLLLLRLGVKSIADIPKRRLNGFIAEVNRKVKAIFGNLTKLTLKNMEKFMSADRKIGSKIFGVFGKSGANQLSDDAMWSGVMNDPVPGIGIEPKTLMPSLAVGALIDIGRLIRRAFADRWTMGQLTAAIVGTAVNGFKDGLMNKLRRQFVTVLNSFIQHVSSYVMFKIGSLTHTHYQWISVLDSHTTDICRGRSGRIYEYATGPRPPAHWNCRSTILPVIDEVPHTLPTYWEWINRQPAVVQVDAIGRVRAAALREGRLKSADVPTFDGTGPLTLEEYADTVNKMIIGVA